MKKVLALSILLGLSIIRTAAQTPSATINGTPPPYIFNGTGVSQSGQTFTFSSSGGGDAITSPHSTISVGGSAGATTLDLAGSAGQIMAGATPALTFTPTLGIDGTSAGTLQTANGASAAHTIWGSAATTSNTILGFATVPTNGHVVTCTVSGTTCTLTDGGAPGIGTVTSVGFTGGLISVANPTTTPALTVAGTSGGVSYFSSASTWASSAALTHYGVVYGGGPGGAPVATAADTTTTHALFATSTAPAFRALALTDLPSLSANTVLGAVTATTPSGLPMPSCSGASNALIWTSGTGFGCNTLSGSGTVTVVSSGSLTSTALVTGGGSQAIQTPSGTATMDSSGNISTPGSVTATLGLISGNPSGGVGSQLFFTQEGTVPSGLSAAGQDNCYSDSTQHGLLCNFNAGTTLPLVQGPASDTSGHVASFSGTNGGKIADSGVVAANLVVASSPGAGVAHFAGSTQTVTSSAVSLTADVSGVLPNANGGRPAISNTTFTNATTAVGGNACSASAVTVTMNGLTTSSVILITPSTDVSGSTGWGSTGGLVIDAWPSASNTMSYKICNQTSGSITPAAVTWNVGAQ